MINDWRPEYILLTGIAIGLTIPTMIDKIFAIIRRVNNRNKVKSD